MRKCIFKPPDKVAFLFCRNDSVDADFYRPVKPTFPGFSPFVITMCLVSQIQYTKELDNGCTSLDQFSNMFCCGYISVLGGFVIHLPISRVASLVLRQLCDCPRASEATLKDIGKWLTSKKILLNRDMCIWLLECTVWSPDVTHCRISC